MQLTPKLAEALRSAAHAPGHRLVRCHHGFRPAGTYASQPVVTRRTANALVNAMLADYNCPVIPSALTLTPKGRAMAADMPEPAR